KRHGVFTNTAFTEPFGLTLIEASASGLPIVATDDGGPKDIIGNCHNGILVDVQHEQEIADALKKLLTDEKLWEQCSRNGITGVRRLYTWKAHAERYVQVLDELCTPRPRPSAAARVSPIGKLFQN